MSGNDKKNPNSAMADALKKAQQAKPGANQGDASAKSSAEQHTFNQQQQQSQQTFDNSQQQTDFNFGQSNAGNNMNNEQNNDFSWAQFDTMLPGGLDVTSSNANLTGIIKEMQEIIKDPANKASFPAKFVTIDATKYGVGLPAILVYGTFNGTAYAHALLVNDRELEPRKWRDAQQREIDVPTTPADVFSPEYVKVAEEAIKSMDKAVNNVIVTGAGVIPGTIDPEKDQKAVKAALYVSASAIITVARINMDPNVVYFNFDRMLAKTNLRTRMDFSTDCVQDHLGQLHRSDIRIDMYRQQQGRDNHSAVQSVPLTSVSGYIDLHYVNMQNQMGGQMGANQMNPYGMMMPQGIVPSYVPRFIMTHVASQVGAKTMELMLLAMSTVNIALYNGNAWKFALKPNTSRLEHDRRDIGALGLDVATAMKDPAWRGRIKTKTAQFDDTALQTLLQAAVIPQLGFAIDCVVAGEDSWMTNVWVRAAQGHPDSVARIFTAANNLTNGRFDNHFKQMAASMGHNVQVPFSPEVQKIHMGTYTDPLTHELRDLRDWDELAMLNYLGESDLNKAQAFGSTFDSTSLSEAERLEERLRIMKSVSPSVKVTGYAVRVTPSAAFIKALGAALAENPTINNQPEITGIVTEQAQRGNTTMLNYTTGFGPDANSLYRNNFGNNGAQGFQSYTPFI